MSRHLNLAQDSVHRWPDGWSAAFFHVDARDVPPQLTPVGAAEISLPVGGAATDGHRHEPGTSAPSPPAQTGQLPAPHTN